MKHWHPGMTALASFAASAALWLLIAPAGMWAYSARTELADIGIQAVLAAVMLTEPVEVEQLRHHHIGCIAFAGGHYIATWNQAPDGGCRILGVRVAS